jgi:hypothetical protein
MFLKNGFKNIFQIKAKTMFRSFKTNGRPPEPIHAYNLLNTLQYKTVKNDFCKKLEENSPKYFYMNKKSLNPIPMIISKSQLNEYKNIQEALSSAIQVVVLNFYKDIKIQSALNLDENVKTILELYRDRSFYKIGSYR